jgi:hypothetical protein
LDDKAVLDMDQVASTGSRPVELLELERPRRSLAKE